MTAHCYNLQTELPTHDFYPWLITVVAKGATEIVIDKSIMRTSAYFDHQAISDRIESIMLPGPPLFGLPVRFGTDGDRSTTCRTEDFIAFISRNSWPRIKSILPPRNDVAYTVTMRNQRKSPHRNSDQGVWRRFADEIGALVIEDYVDKPYWLHEVLAAYAGAKMNFGVNTGLTFLLSLTEYPMIQFKFGAGSLPFLREKCSMNWGDPWPWLASNQKIIWESDTWETVTGAFRQWRK